MFKAMLKAIREVYSVVPVIIVVFFIMGGIIIAAGIATTYLTEQVIEGVQSALDGNLSRSALYILIAVYLVVGLLYFIANAINNFIWEFGFDQKANFVFRIRLGEHAAKLGLLNYEDSKFFDLMKLANNSVAGRKLAMSVTQLSWFVIGLGTMIGVTTVLATFSPWLVPLAILSCIPKLIAKIKRGKRMNWMQMKRVSEFRELSYLWKLFLSPVHIKEMRTLGFSEFLSKRWEDTNTEVNEEIWSFNKKEARTMFLIDLFNVLCYITGIVVSVWLVINGTITIAQFGACIAAFLTMQASMRQFASNWAYLPVNQEHVENYFKFMNLKPNAHDNKGFEGIRDKLELRNINFKYPNTDKNALSDINLTIKKGEKIALIGENGSGKTTLSKLILGLYPPETGNIMLDGEDIKSYDTKSFYEHFSMVSQDFVKYALLLRENVALGDIAKLYDDAKLHSTIERASADEVIERTGGLDGMLGREFQGTELSGGQWQKLAISRGLFKDYDFIVLDEPTSALDPIVETDIFKKFLDAMDNKTALIISHRVGLCRLADRIVVLQDGKVSETGSHDELMAKKEHYFELFTSQQQWYV